MKITREKLRQWGACYDDKRISELVPKSGLTPLEIAALENVPVEDRMWVLLREAIIPARELRLLACGWAEGACRAAGWDDQRSLEAIAVARRFAVGEASEAELAAAWTEAARAAREAALSLWAAALSPRGAAAEAAAAASAANRDAWSSSWWSVAGAAWLTADAAAAWTADWASAATRAAQLADVVRVLRKSEGGTQE